ncbi:MAG: recombinase family protein [Rudaea sp.]|nr:recombinase family protein [Rudaea sp.]
MNTRPLRCAVYTRKSSDEGLEQSFNSLDAQREACAAFIQSQRHEGWKLLPTLYDDGGYSGGTLDRPALQQLLADVTSGAVDLIVVYKVDRLTRSLSDFAKIVEQLDARNVSFVSVTQAFNTTTSMGRLTLNVLLSFAQFEREVTGERIRDKIAASKRKGMWMGGLVPIGYDCVDRKLVVNPAEADQVRHIFERYLALGSVAKLRDELRGQGFRSKKRSTASGGTYGGCSLTSGALFAVLSNRIYRGQISHRGQVYPGQHERIVSDELWDAVAMLRQKTRRANSGTPRAQAKRPLLGVLWTDRDEPYRAVFSTKGYRRYPYYVSDGNNEKRSGSTIRLPALELEGHVADCLRAFFANPQRVLDAAIVDGDAPSAKKSVLAAAQMLAAVESTHEQGQIWRPMLSRIRFADGELTVELDRAGVRAALGLAASLDEETQETETIALAWPLQLYRTAHNIRLIIPSGGVQEAGKPNDSLIRFVARGRRWYKQLTSGEMPSIKAIAAAENLNERYVARLLKGSLLAPDILQRILDGKQPVTLSVERLYAGVSADWPEQRVQLGLTRAQ